jgi:hypothetical protein
MGESGDAGNQHRLPTSARTSLYLVEEALHTISVCVPPLFSMLFHLLYACSYLLPMFYFSAIQRSLRAIAVHAAMHTR